MARHLDQGVHRLQAAGPRLRGGLVDPREQGLAADAAQHPIGERPLVGIGVGQQGEQLQVPASVLAQADQHLGQQPQGALVGLARQRDQIAGEGGVGAGRRQIAQHLFGGAPLAVCQPGAALDHHLEQLAQAAVGDVLVGADVAVQLLG
ncbi:MAG: hypothetical protein QGH45_05075 [Myxococcota bacterium]|nr:hypothetical protein [Myxococcota bacterium]